MTRSGTSCQGAILYVFIGRAVINAWQGRVRDIVIGHSCSGVIICRYCSNVGALESGFSGATWIKGITMQSQMFQTILQIEVARDAAMGQ